MKVICKVLAGSHLFGTNTPESDKDYKGVYLPSLEAVILGNAKNTIVESTGDPNAKNSKDDIDTEFWSLKKFFDLIYQANNHALEVLFAPDSHIIETSNVWEEIRKRKHELVCRNVSSYIHYAKSQSSKYGVKGSRVAAVKKALDTITIVKDNLFSFRNQDPEKFKLEEVWPFLKSELKNVEHIEFKEATEKQPIPYVEIVNRKFQKTVNLKYTFDALTKIYDNYGYRAKLAKDNQNIDWKAISHAYRVGVQAYELLKTGNITLPLPEKEASYIRQLKANKDVLTIPYSEISPVLDELADNLIYEVEKSNLRDSINQTYWNSFLIDVYRNHHMVHGE